MLTLIFLIIFVLSFLGMFFITIRKWPELKAVSVLTQEQGEQMPFGERMKGRIRDLKPIKNFSSERLLKKFFMRLKIILSRSERKVDGYLHKVSHSQKFENDYWNKIRKGE